MIFTKYVYRLVMMLSLLMLMLSIPTTVKAADHQPGIVLSFDDTFVDLWYDFFSQSDVSDVKATFFVSHWHTLSAEKKEKLHILQSNGHEIGHHGYSHKGVSRDFNYDPNRIEEYLNQEVIPALNNMQADGFNPVSFSYPYGEHDYNYDTAIKSYLPYLRTTFADTNKPLAEINEIYHSENKSYGFLAGDGLDNAYENEIDEIQNALIRAKNNNEIVTFYAHRIIPDNSPDASHRYGIKASKLLNVINSARQLGLKFYTFQEAYEISSLPPPPPPSSNNVITSVEDGNRIRINWDNQENDFIGIVPANQSEWQEGMPAVSTDGSSTGKVGITVPNPAPNQEYVAILYLNGTKVATSDSFVISVSTLPEIKVQVATDNTVTVTWNDLINDFIGIVPANQNQWQAGMPSVQTSSNSAGEIALAITDPIFNQNYVAMFYFEGTKIATSTPFIFTDVPPPSSYEITTSIEAGNRVRISWSGLNHNFIGIVPANQTEWQEGMAGSLSSEGSTGKMGITVPDPIPNQEYVAIFYLNGIKVGNSTPFVILDAPNNNTYEIITSVEAGNRVRISWTDLENDFIGVVPIDQNEWQEGMAGSASTDGSTGKMGITVPNPTPSQQYVVMFYLNGIKTATSEAFIIQ